MAARVRLAAMRAGLEATWQTGEQLGNARELRKAAPEPSPFLGVIPATKLFYRRDNMKRTLLAAAAALTFITAAPAVAQMTMTTEQQTMYDGWTAENRAAYDAWPMEAKTYYWTLTPEQTKGWWVLNDEQRVRIVGMTPDQRAAAWTSIMAQMNGTDASATTTTTTSTTTASPGMSTMASGDMQFVRKEVTQGNMMASSAATAEGADLPVCKANQQDGCINSWEKNKTGTRPLNYWPGKPASETPGSKPQG